MADPGRAASKEGERTVGRSLPAGMLDSPDALAARLKRSPTSEDLILLIAGNGSGQALAAALETARGLSLESPTLLVDLGATQDWFADILDREDSGRIRSSRPCRPARGLRKLQRRDPTGPVVEPGRHFFGRKCRSRCARRGICRARGFLFPRRFPRIGLEGRTGERGCGHRGRRRDCRAPGAAAADARRVAPETRRRRRRASRACGSPAATDFRRGGVNGTPFDMKLIQTAEIREFTRSRGDQVDEMHRQGVGALQD